MSDLSVRRAQTQPLPSPSAPPAAPPPPTEAPAAPASAPQPGMAADAARPGRGTGTSRLTLPGSGALSTASGVVGAYQGLTSGAGRMADGVQSLAEGNYVDGAVSTGKGALEMTRSAAAAAGHLRDTSGALGVGQNSRLVQGADAMVNKLTTGPVAARLAATGGALSAAGGASRMWRGGSEIASGQVVQGSLDLAGGAITTTQGVAGMARALQPAGAVAKALGGRVAPVLGVASGAIQTATALAGNPPDYQRAATGAMTTVGSALMPFPPIGTVAGGALVAGAAVIDNWDTITAGADMIGGQVADAAHAVGDAARDAARTVGDAAISAASQAADGLKSAGARVASWFGF